MMNMEHDIIEGLVNTSGIQVKYNVKDRTNVMRDSHITNEALAPSRKRASKLEALVDPQGSVLLSRTQRSALVTTYPGYAGYCDIRKGGLSSSPRWLGLEGNSPKALGQTVSHVDDGGIGWCDGRGGIKVHWRRA